MTPAVYPWRPVLAAGRPCRRGSKYAASLSSCVVDKDQFVPTTNWPHSIPFPFRFPNLSSLLIKSAHLHDYLGS